MRWSASGSAGFRRNRRIRRTAWPSRFSLAPAAVAALPPSRLAASVRRCVVAAASSGRAGSRRPGGGQFPRGCTSRWSDRPWRQSSMGARVSPHGIRYDSASGRIRLPISEGGRRLGGGGALPAFANEATVCGPILRLGIGLRGARTSCGGYPCRAFSTTKPSPSRAPPAVTSIARRSDGSRRTTTSPASVIVESI